MFSELINISNEITNEVLIKKLKAIILKPSL
jgi:hypothetical protein